MLDVYGCLRLYGASNTTNYLLGTTEKSNTQHKFPQAIHQFDTFTPHLVHACMFYFMRKYFLFEMNNRLKNVITA